MLSKTVAGSLAFTSAGSPGARVARWCSLASRDSLVFVGWSGAVGWSTVGVSAGLGARVRRVAGGFEVVGQDAVAVGVVEPGSLVCC